MNKKAAYELADILAEAGLQEMDILGGEPMLVPWIKEFVQYTAGTGILVNISTNGSLPHVVDAFSEIETNLLNIGFSILGFPKTHNMLTSADNFSKTFAGIRSAIEKGKDPIVKSVLTHQNIYQIYDLAAWLRECGVTRYYLLFEDIIGRKKNTDCMSFPKFWEFYSKMRKELEGILDIGFVAASGFYKHGIAPSGICDAGTTKIALLPDGSVFPCNLFFGFKEFRLGNIFTDSMEKIWDSPVLDMFRRQRRKRCNFATCSHYQTCSGGCPAHSYFFFGTIVKADPRCIMRKS